MRKLFGTDGIRGRVGSGKMTPELALKLGWAAGKILTANGTNSILIGKDTRISGYLFESALEAGFTAAGLDVMLLGPMPTPAIAYLTKTFRAEAGVVISASHNPYYDNGIKFFSAKGYKLQDQLEIDIETKIDEPLICVESHQIGKVTRINDAAGRYIEHCKKHFPQDLTLQGLKIVVDCAHGATYHIAPNVFKELGAEVIIIGASPNGLNINDGYGATSTDNLRLKVIETKADIGIAFDGDGDRLAMIDSNGDKVDGDQILYILAAHAKNNGYTGGVVGTLMSNFGLEQALLKLNIPFVRSNVGDRYVVEELIKNKWRLGGENSGHILDLEHMTTGDGIIASILILSIIVRENKNLIELLKNLTMFPQILINVKFDDSSDPLKNPKVISITKEIETKLIGTGRVLLRKSGTEPLIRVMVEGNDLVQVQSYAEQIAQAVTQ